MSVDRRENRFKDSDLAIQRQEMEEEKPAEELQALSLRKKHDCGALEGRRKINVNFLGGGSSRLCRRLPRQARRKLRIGQGFSSVESHGGLDLHGGDGVER